MAVTVDFSKIQMIPVTSSNIRSIGAIDKYLIVEFNSGAKYAYPGASKYINEMRCAPSVGKFFSTRIRPDFDAIKLS